MRDGASEKGLSAAPAGQTVTSSTGNNESAETTRSRKAQASPGLEFPRFFSTAGVDPFDQVEWESRDAIIGNTSSIPSAASFSRYRPRNGFAVDVLLTSESGIWLERNAFISSSLISTPFRS